MIYKKTCPICKQKLQNELVIRKYHCINNCYVLREGTTFVQITIFNELFFSYYNPYSQEAEYEVNNEINYWTENDKYLIKILGK